MFNAQPTGMLSLGGGGGGGGRGDCLPITLHTVAGQGQKRLKDIFFNTCIFIGLRNKNIRCESSSSQ